MKDGADVDYMIDKLAGFDGTMYNSSEQATVYNFWNHFFFGSLFHS